MKQTTQRQAWVQRANTAFDGALGGVALVALHEWDALRGHWAEAQERLVIARRARGAGELLRDQLDLIAESRNRLRRDHEIRRKLWRGLLRDLSRRARQTADA
jgi:hypothetical protein